MSGNDHSPSQCSHESVSPTHACTPSSRQVSGGGCGPSRGEMGSGRGGGEQPSQAGTAALVAWLRAEGGYVHPRVASARVGGRRGLHVRPGASAVPAGAVLLRVPLRCCVAGSCVGDVAKRFHAGWAAGDAREAAYASAVDWDEVCCVGEWSTRRRRRERLDASLALQDVCRADADANRRRNPALYKAHCLCMSRAFSFSAARGTVLVPVVDVMNHSVVGRNVSFSCDGDDDDGAVVVRAAAPGGFPPGAAAELLCVYGALSPAQLVHDYSIPLHPRGAEFLHALRHYSAAPLLAACRPPPLLPAAAAPPLSSPSALYLPRPFGRARLAALFGSGDGVRRRLRACARGSLREGRRRVAAAVAAAKRATGLSRVSGALQGKGRRWRRRPTPVGLLVLLSECVGLRRLLRVTRRAWPDADARRVGAPPPS
eukprot:Rhum_TRINITY_DN14966_c3_g2::Rhum_TRINITY_DN14966_c3_g2_i1::g.129261::m.129261